MVSAQTISGSNSVGMRDKSPANKKYKRPIACEHPSCPFPKFHETYECPKLFADTFKRAMPGFYLDGRRDGKAWENASGGNEICPDLHKVWAAIMKEGFFKENPYPHSPAAPPDPSKERPDRCRK
eukprot:1257514-Rhodomonas_salina.1